MSSNAMVTTVVGWAATAPREIHAGRVPYTSFRLASTPRHFDRARGVWVEGRTEWLTVKAFRGTALNVALSVQKGQPIIVTGRLRTEEWQGENGTRSSLVLEASALGHDLTRGRSTFVKTTHVAAEPAEEGAPGMGGAVGAMAAAGTPDGQHEEDDVPTPGHEFDPWALGGPAGDDAASVPAAVAAELADLDDAAVDEAIDELTEELSEQLAAGLAVDA